MADKDGMERKVYLLPTELVARIRAYQDSQNIASEVEAARRLLNESLQLRDSIDDLLIQVKSRWELDKDLRVISREVLSNHALVEVIHITDSELKFTLRNKNIGSIDHKGRMKKGAQDNDGSSWLTDWPLRSSPGKLTRSSERATPVLPPANASGEGHEPNAFDLDEDIPN